MNNAHRPLPPPPAAASPTSVEKPKAWIRRVLRDRRRLYTTWTREMEAALGIKHGDFLRYELDANGRLIVERLDEKKFGDPELRAEVEYLQLRQRSIGIQQAAQWNLWHRDYYYTIYHHRRRAFTPTPTPLIEQHRILPTPSPKKRKAAGESA